MRESARNEQDISAGQLLIDGLTGMLLGVLAGSFTGLASGIFVAVIMFCIPLLAVIGIMAVVYNVAIGAVGGAASGIVCGLVSGYRSVGWLLPMLGAMTSGACGVALMLRMKSYGWEGTQDWPFMLYGLVIGMCCGVTVSAVIGFLNRPKVPFAGDAR